MLASAPAKALWSSTCADPEPTRTTMKLSVCIPAYNRPAELTLLLKSVLEQDYDDFEVVVSDDNSPRAAEIQEAVEAMRRAHPERRLSYSLNEKTLGFDGHLRRILTKASGDYCIYMADDDLLCPGALRKIGRAVSENANVGVVLRSWVLVDRATEQVTQTYRYFDSDRWFPPGADTIVTFYRRALFISGVVVHREAAIRRATERFDGTLLYQLYLVGSLLATMGAFYVADVLVVNRTSGTHFFGTSEKEKGRFAPGKLTPEHSLNFVKGQLDIARHVEAQCGVPVFGRIMRDMGNYAYTMLRYQAQRRLDFLRYAWALARLGFWRNWHFGLHFLTLLVLGPRWTERLVEGLKAKLGRAPMLGTLYAGERR